MSNVPPEVIYPREKDRWGLTLQQKNIASPEVPQRGFQHNNIQYPIVGGQILDMAGFGLGCFIGQQVVVVLLFCSLIPPLVCVVSE